MQAFERFIATWQIFRKTQLAPLFKTMKKTLKTNSMKSNIAVFV
jgi:hypothetical protein